MEFEFTSTRALHSCVFYSELENKYILYAKGSDDKIMSLLDTKLQNNELQAMTRANEFAWLGYRTLFYGLRYFEKESF